MMRVLFLLLFLAGVGLAGLPWFTASVMSREIGTWRLYTRAGGAVPVQAALAGDLPVDVLVDMTTRGDAADIGARPLMRLTAAKDGAEVLATDLTFAGAAPRVVNPQFSERAYRESAGTIPAGQPGLHVFAVALATPAAVEVETVELVLKRHVDGIDERVQPAGFVLMAIGFIGLVLSFRGPRGGSPGNPNSQPPAPRWGRDAAPPPAA